MNQEMYGAIGKVGNKVYYKSNGKTVARELVTPKNPKTDAQTVQRVIAAQVGKDYKKFQDLCNHSFEGVTMGAQSMNMFRKLNMRYARERAAYLQQSGQSLAQFYNFQPIGSTKWVPGAVIIAQGMLPKIPVQIELINGTYYALMPLAENTYQAVLDEYGLQRGDQLTFVTVEKEYDEYVVKLCRCILDPRNADGSGAAMSTQLITDGNFTKPNWRNNGVFKGALAYNSGIQFHISETGVLVAAAIIVSRKDSDGNWERNNAQLTLSEDACGADLCSLMGAVDGSYSNTGSIDLESEQYLNNAGTGGTQGSEDTPVTPPSNTPTYNNTVSINGASQNIAGGSVTVTAPVNSVTITGTNLAASDDCYAVKSGSATHIQPTSTSATQLQFTGLSVAAGSSITFYKDNGTQWFVINAQAAGGDGGDGGD